MKTRLLVLSGSALIGMAMVSLAIAPVLEANADPLLTAQSNVAVGAIDPSEPVLIEVVNAGGVPILTRLTLPATEERLVAPGDTITFGSLATSYLPLPINFLAYPEEQDVGLSLYVLTEGNTVRVVVGQARSEVPGSTAMNIDALGGIYIY